MKQYLTKYRSNIDLSELSNILEKINFKQNDSVLNELSSNHFRIIEDNIIIGKREEITDRQYNLLNIEIENLRPWRKGPFSLFGRQIESEWNSGLKWSLIEQHIGSLKGLKVLDIGCNNGYYLLRAHFHNPELLIGIDPVLPCFQQFHFIKKMIAPSPNLFFEPLGHQHLYLFKSLFDIVFCLGIIYHVTDPISLLRNIHKTLTPKGKIILEAQGIPGDDSFALVPKSRYANAKGMWYLPTVSCLKNWLHRSGFKNIELFDQHKLDFNEQKSGEDAPVSSFSSGLDPNDKNKTIEGYPAPIRIYISAHKN